MSLADIPPNQTRMHRRLNAGEFLLFAPSRAAKDGSICIVRPPQLTGRALRLAPAEALSFVTVQRDALCSRSRVSEPFAPRNCKLPEETDCRLGDPPDPMEGELAVYGPDGSIRRDPVRSIADSGVSPCVLQAFHEFASAELRRSNSTPNQPCAACFCRDIAAKKVGRARCREANATMAIRHNANDVHDYALPRRIALPSTGGHRSGAPSFHCRPRGGSRDDAPRAAPRPRTDDTCPARS
jgi:hypothetical protein